VECTAGGLNTNELLVGELDPYKCWDDDVSIEVVLSPFTFLGWRVPWWVIAAAALGATVLFSLVSELCRRRRRRAAAARARRPTRQSAGHAVAIGQPVAASSLGAASQGVALSPLATLATPGQRLPVAAAYPVGAGGGAWPCAVCTYLNANAGFLQCEVCGAARPRQQSC